MMLAGLTTALALVPGSIAFAFVAGVPPISGLYAGFRACLIMAAPMRISLGRS